MARYLYSFLFYLVTPLITLRLLWRSLQAPAYRKRIRERFGFLAIEPHSHTIWIHCVSVGETLAAAPLIEALLTQKAQYKLLITSTTPTGSAQVQRLFGERVAHYYMPYDLPDCIGRFLRRVKPIMALIIETEVWPNMIHSCQQHNIPTILMNARMSQRSCRGYKKLPSLTQPMFAALNLITAQSEADATRLKTLGARHIVITGSLKNDFSITATMRKQATHEKSQWQQVLGENLVCLIAASTHANEDQIILEAFRTIHQQHSNTLLLLIPRHPERFQAVADLSLKASFNTRKRTEKTIDQHTQVLIGDTMGELQMLFGTADIAMMGGTFTDNGGHNFLEPAAWGLPILSGKSLFNFAAISEALVKKQALVTVDTSQALAKETLVLINDISARTQRGQAARHYVEQNRGAVRRNIEQLEHLLH